MDTRKPATLFPDAKRRRPTVLVVEDEILLRVALADYLRECGFRVYEAGAGQDALAILRVRRTALDLVLSDIDMPGEVDGFALAQWIRKHKPKLPVVLAGSDDKKSEAADGLCRTAHFFAKPYDLRRVVVFIRNAIQAKAGKRV